MILVERTEAIILKILKNNKVRNVKIVITGFKYNPEKDAINLDILDFLVCGFDEDTATGLFNTMAELHACNIYPKLKRIIIS